jgi:hypothetical protein
LLFFRCLKNNIYSSNGSEASDEDLMDPNSHKERADQRSTTSPEQKVDFRHLRFRRCGKE